MKKKVRGLGVLYCGEYEFLILPDEDGKPKPGIYAANTFFCARKFPISEDRAEFRSPAWLTVLGGGFIRWETEEKFFDVEFP